MKITLVLNLPLQSVYNAYVSYFREWVYNNPPERLPEYMAPGTRIPLTISAVTVSPSASWSDIPPPVVEPSLEDLCHSFSVLVKDLPFRTVSLESRFKSIAETHGLRYTSAS